MYKSIYEGASTANPMYPKELNKLRLVREFHLKHNCSVRYHVNNPEVHPEELCLRARLIREEAKELLAELYKYRPDMGDIAKEMADVLYVVYGTAVALGIDLNNEFKSVHMDNMSKPVGPKRTDGKVLKG